MRLVKVIIRYFAALILLAFCTLSLEMLSGLIPQEPIRAHLLESVGQLQEEGLTPGILYTLHPRSLIDNFSENYILTYSYYMNTRSDPVAVLTNPGRSIKEPAKELFVQTEELLREQLPPDTHYSRYWMGFRMYVRPLLALMNYMDIRQSIQLVFYLLLGLVTLVLYRNSGSLLIALSFLMSIALLNPVAITACFQYSTCFFLAFAFMLTVPRIAEKDRQIMTVPLFFFLAGATTQIFDFYTAPLLTFGYPFLMLASSEDYRGRDGIRKCIQTFGTWLLGYVLCWLVKLSLTTALTSVNGFKEGFSRFSMWMLEGSGSQERDLLLPLKAVFYNVINIADLVPTVLLGVLLCLYALAQVRRKRRNEGWISGYGVYILVAALPIVWFLIAAKPSFGHAYFQYRSVGVSVFSGLLFLIRTAEWDFVFCRSAERAREL